MYNPRAEVAIDSNDPIRDSLVQQFPNDIELVNYYISLIKNETPLDDTKFRKSQMPEIPHSLIKIQGQHFLFNKTLGKGFCGTSKKAIHLETGKSIVVKVTKPALPIISDLIYRIAENEKRILAYLNKNPLSWEREINFQTFSWYSLAGSNFNRVLNGKKIYIIQPFVKGVCGEEHRNTTFTIAKATVFIKSILMAMKELHDRNVFHGDIKLENIIFDPDNNKSIFIDFGLSQLVDQQGQVKDNQLWMPHHFLIPKPLVGLTHQKCPEWSKGQTLGLDSDIYALGETLKDFIQTAKFDADPIATESFKEDMMQRIINPMLEENRHSRPSIDDLLSIDIDPRPADVPIWYAWV